MKALFYTAILGLLLFEIVNVYFIMPLPGSQEMNSIDAAYFLHRERWFFRALFLTLIVLGFKDAWTGSKVLPVVAVLVVGGLFYMTNFTMAADTMFYQPSVVAVKALAENRVDRERLVLGVAHNGEARAYPIQFLGYHHQVRDSVGGKPIMVTYCTVCRTGRVYEPVVDGRTEEFRLVGMDHFNAMFEDKTTRSWWRQVTGEAVAGKLKGQTLPEFPSVQTTLAQWSALYPHTLVMQPDPKFQAEYDSMATFEGGRLTGMLTRRDTASWLAKSWVVGVESGSAHKAFDWNELVRQRILYDEIDGRPVAIVLASDNKSFVALERGHKGQTFTVANDMIRSDGKVYNLLGQSADPAVPDLKRLPAYQEYWHSWQTFHPN
jgi:hypothetical protein